MKVYHYNPNSFEYVGMTDANIDYAESEVRKKKVWLLPDSATFKKPPTSQPRTSCYFDSKRNMWVKYDLPLTGQEILKLVKEKKRISEKEFMFLKSFIQEELEFIAKDVCRKTRLSDESERTYFEARTFMTTKGTDRLSRKYFALEAEVMKVSVRVLVKQILREYERQIDRERVVRARYVKWVCVVKRACKVKDLHPVFKFAEIELREAPINYSIGMEV